MIVSVCVCEREIESKNEGECEFMGLRGCEKESKRERVRESVCVACLSLHPLCRRILA